MTFTVSYGAYLQNAVDRVVTVFVTRFSLLKTEQLRDVCLFVCLSFTRLSVEKKP